MASTVVDLFERRVELAPGAVAVAAAGRELSYRDLALQAGRLARRLVQLGVGPEVLVALHLGRGLEMVAAMLGVLEAGGAYLPLDPAFPPERLEFMLRDSRARVVLCERRREPKLSSAALVLDVEEALADGEEAGPPGRAPAVHRALPENLAYVLYTSGSTGRPKGVQVPHRALVNFLLSMRERPGFTPRDVLLAVTTLSFDIAALEIFLPLIAGGRLVIAPRAATLDGAQLAELLKTSGATVLQATPITWKLLLQAGWQGDGRLRMLCGGEALPRELAHTLLGRGAALWNLYGPTETTVWSALARVAPGEGPVPIGRPIASTELLILDEELRPVPAGLPGGLYVGGAGLARGYLGQPALTAERFVPHPHGTRPGARLYRTGDLASSLADGQLEFLGRADHQVKIRGFRIELGEIESVLLEHPGVADAAVVAAPSKSGEKRLAAYLVARRGPPPDLGELRALAARRLPEHMRPAVWAFLAALPLTANNKIDRNALPPPAGLPDHRLDPDLEPPAAAALDPIEELVHAIWADVLEYGAVRPDDDFFAAGGHSLLAGQVTARLRAALGLELPPSILFEHPTPARLAREIETRRRAGSGLLPPLVPVGRSEPLPASYAQERLWLYEQLEPGGNAFNLAYAFRLRGKPSRAALTASLAEVARRHEILRTRIAGQDRPFQIVDPAPGHPPRPLPLADLSGLPLAAREHAAEGAAGALHARPFDLARGPLLRAALLRLAEDEHIFSLTIHHILCDGWSLGVLMREVTAVYAGCSSGSPPALPAPPIQYADFAAWQRGWLAGDRLEEQLAWWDRHLGRGCEPATLPADGRRPGGRVGEVRRAIPGELLQALLRLGREQGATLFMTLLAALQLLLHRYTGCERVVVGGLHANRGHSAVEELIGFFVNVLPLATEVRAEWTFRELLGRVRETALGAYAHQDAPYQKIVERVRPDRAAGRNALFQVMAVQQNVPPPLRLAGLEVTPWEPGEAPRRAAFDLTLSFILESRQLLVLLEYDQGLYDLATARRLISDFERVLRDIACDPAQLIAELPRLEADERRERARPDGALGLITAPAATAEDATDGALMDGALTAGESASAQQKSLSLQDQVAARRSQLSPKRLELLRQRLKK
jgi:amino acid adenylation domain-containing protein